MTLTRSAGEWAGSTTMIWGAFVKTCEPNWFMRQYVKILRWLA